MWFTDLRWFPHSNKILLNEFYSRLCLEFDLPSLDILLKSLRNDVSWVNVGYRVEIYYLENMREQNDKSIFEVRFPYAESSNDLANLHMSVHNAVIQNMTINFPRRAGQITASKVIALYRSVVNLLRVDYVDLNMKFEGFAQDRADMISDKSLGAFVWDENLRIYFHRSERIEIFKATLRKGQ